ncbi:MFS transporter (plasmid) [Legionella israelensis]|nr:MFS transporter [Legionella israelensis]
MVTSLCLNIPAYFKKASHLHYDLIGQFISIYYCGCLVGALAGGCLTLYFRTTMVSGIGLIFLSGSLFCLFNTTSYWIIFSSMLLLGSIGTAVATSNIASLLKSVKEREKVKLKVISIDLILFNISFSFATYVLLDLDTEQVTFIICTICTLLIFASIWLLTIFQNYLFDPIKEKIRGAFSLPDHKIEFTLLISMVFCFGLIFSMVKVIFTPTLIDRFGSNIISVTIASINPWVVFIFQPLIVDRVRNSNSTWFLGFGGFIVGISYFLFGNVTSFTVTAISLLLLTFGEMMFAPLSKHFNIQLYRKGEEGVASGIWKAVFLGSGAIGSGVSGYFAESYGSYIVWEICGLLGMTCFIFSFFLRKMQRRDIYDRVVLDI